MPKMKRARRIVYWELSEHKILKKCAGKVPASKIARQLRRSETAVRQHACSMGVSLRVA